MPKIRTVGDKNKIFNFTLLIYRLYNILNINFKIILNNQLIFLNNF